MDYSEELASRVRALLDHHSLDESRLLDGKGFWVDDGLVASIHGDELLLRVDMSEYATLLTRSGTRPYEFAGRPVPAWLLVGPDAVLDDESLREWLAIGMKRLGG